MRTPESRSLAHQLHLANVLLYLTGKLFAHAALNFSSNFESLILPFLGPPAPVSRAPYRIEALFGPLTTALRPSGRAQGMRPVARTSTSVAGVFN